jgi:hypothetical protein
MHQQARNFPGGRNASQTTGVLEWYRNRITRMSLNISILALCPQKQVKRRDGLMRPRKLESNTSGPRPVTGLVKKLSHSIAPRQ